MRRQTWWEASRRRNKTKRKSKRNSEEKNLKEIREKNSREIQLRRKIFSNSNIKYLFTFHSFY